MRRIGLFLRCVRASGRERDPYFVPGSLGGLHDRGTPNEDDQIGE